MSGLPRDVWEAADAAGDIINAGIWMGDEGPSIIWGEARMAIGNAILAERKRCADVARHLNGWGPVGGHVVAEHIAKVIESGQ